MDKVGVLRIGRHESGIPRHLHACKTSVARVQSKAGNLIVSTSSASSSDALALLLWLHLQRRYPHLPSRHRCQNRCSGDLSRTLHPLPIRNLHGSPRRCSHHPRRHYRDSLEHRHHWTQDLHLEVRLQELLLTVQSTISDVMRCGSVCILTSSAISFFVLMPLARKKFSSGCCSSLR